MKYYLIAGEASGDLHGSRLVSQLKIQDPDAEIQAWGGDLMAEAGAQIKKHYRDLAFMGFTEVIQNIWTIYKNFGYCKKDILVFQPDALILIDYPGFNLRMATWAKSKGLRVFYYISPQLWAWKADRAYIIKKSVDQLYTILPFENEFYKSYEVYPEYVGHPLLETVHDFKPNPEVAAALKNKNVLALLPGSRKQEIVRMLPVYLKTLSCFPEFTAVIAAAPSQPISLYQDIINQCKSKNAIIFQNQTYSILNLASMAWVSSGTATLETALFGVPQVVCYTGNALSYQIARRLVKVKYISLVNLILDKPLIPELIQHNFTEETLIQTTKKLSIDHIKTEYQKLYQLLLPDNASYLVAHSIIHRITKTSQ
jgi:lipid-A-disaccharide synthase